MRTIASLCLVIIITSGCSKSEQQINYLGQIPPSDSAVLFAPGIISTDNYEHSSPAFSPDGSVVLWTVLDRNYRASMMEMVYENGQWSKPRHPTFADSTADDYYPSFAPNGEKLLFSSRRTVPTSYDQGADIRIWQVERTASGWGTPMPFDTVVSKSGDYAQSINSKGDVYFSSAVGGATMFDIRRAGRISNQKYDRPLSLPFNINSVGYEDGPYIAPDESFLIFESSRPGGVDDFIDLYICYMNENGDWSTPINMGPKINSAAAERFAKLSPDGKYLFFGSNRNMTDQHWGFDVYWIDAKIIQELKPAEPNFHAIDWEFGYNTLESLSKEDTSSTARIYLGQWTHQFSGDIDAGIIYSSLLRKSNRFGEAATFLNQRSYWLDNSRYRIEFALVNYGLHKDAEADSLLASVLVAGNKLYDDYRLVAQQLFDMRMFDKSDYYFDKAMSVSPIGYHSFQRGNALAKIGEDDRAFRALNKAVDYGFAAKDMFENSEDLVHLRADRRWKSLMERL